MLSIKSYLSFYFKLVIFGICNISVLFLPSVCHPKQDFYSLTENADKLFKRGAIELSVRSFEDALNMISPQSKLNDYLDVLKRLGVAYQAIGHYQKAITAYQNIYDIVETHNDVCRKSLYFNMFGDLHLSVGETSKAETYFKKASENSQTCNDVLIQASIENNFGNLYAVLQDWPKAEAAYSNAFELVNRYKNDIELKSDILANIARFRIKLAYTGFQSGDYQNIISILHKTYDTITPLTDSFAKARRLMALSQLIQIFRDEIRKASAELYLPLILINKVDEFYQQSLYEHAALSLEEAMLVLDAKKYYGIYLDIIINIASIYHKFGDSKKALTTLEKALPFVRKTNNPYSNTMFLSELGDLYLFDSQVKEGVRYLKDATEEAYHTNDPLLLIEILSHAGNAFTADKNFSDAIVMFDEGLKQIRKIDDLYKENEKIVLEIESILKKVGKLNQKVNCNVSNEPICDDMIVAFDDIYYEFKLMTDMPKKTDTMISLTLHATKVNIEIQQTSDFLKSLSYRALNQAKEIAIRLNDNRTASYSYGYLGKLYEQEGQFEDAIKLTRNASFIAQEGNYSELKFLWFWQMGRLYSKKGHLDNAIKSYYEAIFALNPSEISNCGITSTERVSFANLANLRQELYWGQRVGFSFDKTIRPVYLELAELLLESSYKLQDENARQVKIMEAVKVLNILNNAELQDYFDDRCILAKYDPNVIQLNAVELKNRFPNTSVLYPVCFPDHIVLFLITNAGVRYEFVYADESWIKTLTQEFRSQVQDSSQLLYLDNACQLYDLLIKPIDKYLEEQETKTLIVVPDSFLRLVPFSSLYDGRNFLIERYAIVTEPSLSIPITDSFLSSAKKSRKVSDQTDAGLDSVKGMLFGGILDQTKGFPLRTTSKIEFKTYELINKKSCNILWDDQFTKFNFMQAMKGKYSTLHFSTPVLYGDTQEKTWFKMKDKTVSMWELKDIISNSQSDLLILSCSLTDFRDSRTAIGAIGMAIDTNVKSALVTLWPANDSSEMEIMGNFYKQSDQVSKAYALQNAQRALVGFTDYRHPFYWANFILTGQWK